MVYYKFLKNLFILAFIVFCADYVIGETLRFFFFSSSHSANFETRYAMDSTKADIVIFGSSRANHHYDPVLFEKATGMSCYNCGRDGNFLFYHYAIFKQLSKRYTPKLVILDVIEDELFKTPNDYDRLSILLPYYQTHPAIRPIIEKRSSFEKVKLLSHIYPYNSLLLPIIDGNVGSRSLVAKEFALKGYRPLSGTWNEPEDTYKRKSFEFDENKIQVFKDFINTCKIKKINLIIVVSPYYIKGINNSKSIYLMRNIAKCENVRFLDYSNYAPFQNNEYFHDPFHLNEFAVHLFDSLIIKKIQN